MESLERRLGYAFHDRSLLSEALNHSSYANEHRGGLSSNERLEFLGDSVLGFVSAEFLFKRYGELPEGDLTRMRAALVCEQSLYGVAKELGLGGYLKLGRGEEAGGGRAALRRPGSSLSASCCGRLRRLRSAGTTRPPCRR